MSREKREVTDFVRAGGTDPESTLRTWRQRSYGAESVLGQVAAAIEARFAPEASS